MKLSKSAIDAIKRHEGFSPTPYVDSEGYLTIGYGTRLPISEQEAELLLLLRADNPEEIKILFPSFETLSQTRQDVIINMYYNLGFNRLKAFKKMREAVASGDFLLAAAEMLDSRWARQVGNRAIYLAELMRRGTY